MSSCVYEMPFVLQYVHKTNGDYLIWRDIRWLLLQLRLLRVRVRFGVGCVRLKKKGNLGSFYIAQYPVRWTAQSGSSMGCAVAQCQW